jgi:hypothetical protein
MSEPSTEQQPGANGARPAEYVAKDSAYLSSSVGSEMIRTDAGDVTAESVTMDRSGAEQITADRVRLDRSGAKSITTKSAHLERSGVLNLTADHVVLQGSSATNVSANEARIVKSTIAILRSGSTTVEGRLRTFILIGPAGEHVVPVFDGPSAMRFAATLGVVLLLGGRLLRWLGGR